MENYHIAEKHPFMAFNNNYSKEILFKKIENANIMVNVSQC
jgi:hypothetical protein